MIDKNTIYSYFQTDDFPTEDQFRATWDSFWHKSESIPMSQITGLNQLFQQTATVAQLNNKANVDGSNIDVSAYQEKLNITNLIATAKEEVKTELLNGAPEAFDTLKEISDWISDDETAEAAILQAIQNEATARTNADNLKLNKPTTTSNTTSYPFVVGEDGNGNSARLPAGDLGKNFFNSDLSNTTARNHTMNAGVTINTLGNPYSLTGLPNKNTDITNFDNVVRYNPTTGQFAYGNAFVYNVPSTITVNHVNAPASPNVPSYIQAIQDKITEIHTTAVFQNFNNWTIETLNNLSHSGINVQNNKTVHTNISPFRGIAGISSGQNVINIKTQRILPSNSNWAIKFDLLMATDSTGAHGNYGRAACRKIGIYSDGGSLINPDFYVRDAGEDYEHLITKLSGDSSQYISSRQIGYNMTLRCLILKINTQVLIQVSWGTQTISKIYDIQTLVNNNTSFGFLITAYSLLDTGNPFDNYNALVDNIQYAILS